MLLKWVKVTVIIHSHYILKSSPFWHIAYEKSNQAQIWCHENCKSRWAITNINFENSKVLGWHNSRSIYDATEAERKMFKEKFGIYILFKDIREALLFKLSYNYETK
jgi:hypothetical protein